MRDRDVLDVDRADPLAARLDHVLAAVGDLQEAVGVDRRDVAGREPAVRERRRVAAKVVVDHPRPAHLQFAERDAVPRQLAAIVADDAHVDAADHAPLLLEQPALRVERPLRLRPVELRERTERRQFGHPPRMNHAHAVFVLERAQHRGRARGAADHRAVQRRETDTGFAHVVQQPEPHGRHARGKRHALGLHQLVQRFPVEILARQHQLAARQRHRVRQPPCVDVEHRHDGQHGVHRGQVHRVGQRGAVRMQHGRTIRIQHALRVAGRAGRVAEPRRLLLVEARPVVVAVFRFDERFVAEQRRGGGRQVRGVRHRDPALHVRALRRDRVDQRREIDVEQHVAVFRVIDDVRDLFGKQARIDRVAHGAHPADPVIRFQMPVAVPRQRADAVAGFDAEPRQRLRQLLRAAFAIAVRVAMQVAFHALRHDLRVAGVPRGMRNQRRHEQRHIHHLAQQRLTHRLVLPEDANR